MVRHVFIRRNLLEHLRFIINENQFTIKNPLKRSIMLQRLITLQKISTKQEQTYIHIILLHDKVRLLLQSPLLLETIKSKDELESFICLDFFYRPCLFPLVD